MNELEPTISQPGINRGPQRQSSFSLRLLFQTAIAVAIFFAVFRAFPEIALSLAMFICPALVRTVMAGERLRHAKREFPWPLRLRIFVASIVLVAIAILGGLASFALVSMGFGLLAYVFGASIGLADLGFDAAVMGSLGGMVWGMAAGLIVTVYILASHWESNGTADPPRAV